MPDQTPTQNPNPAPAPTPNYSLAVARRDQLSLSTIVSCAADRISAIESVGQWIAKSRMFGGDNLEVGRIVALVCMETGISLTEFARSYDIVEGKLRKKAMAALAEFRRAGGKFRWLQSGDDDAPTAPDTQAAVLHLEWDGQTTDYRYSMADARREGLVKPGSRYSKRPGNMLRARCVTNALGMLCPEIFAGEFDAEEPAPERELSLGTIANEPASGGEPPLRPPLCSARDAVLGYCTLPAGHVGGHVANGSPFDRERPIDIPVTVVSPPMPSPATVSPAPTAPAPITAPEPVKATIEALPMTPAPTRPDLVGVPIELAQKLMALVTSEPPEFFSRGLTWLRSRQANFADSPWLKPDEGYEHLTEARMKRICNQWPGWKAKVLEFTAAQPK